MPRVGAFPAFSGALADDDLFVVIDVSETTTQQDKTITALHARRQLVRAAYVAATDPGADDDESQGYALGNFGINTSTGELFVLVDASEGAAVWASAGSTFSGNAEDVTYDPASSGLTATDVQAAIDELAQNGGGGGDTSGLLPKLAAVNSYAGSRTLTSDDSGAYVRITTAGTVTLPDGLATGFQCVIVNATAAATVELAAATTLTIPTGFEPELQNRRAVTVIHVGSNVWEAHGALVEQEAP